MNAMRALILSIGLVAAGVAWAGPVNVNTADAKSLAKELTGVGPKTAEAIVAERGNGNFKNAADLQKRVKGFGAKTAEKNQANLKF